MSGIHIAALFETSDAAHAACEALVQAGVEASRILVLDRGHPTTAAHASTPRRLWAVLKHVFMPDDDAHHYAEGIVRGHPLLVADITESEREAAEAALAAHHPLNVEERAEAWRGEGWSGVYAGQQAWEDAVAQDRDAASSEGIVGGGFMVGDYGAVGGAHVHTDTNILRGKQFYGGEATATRVNDSTAVRVYEVE